MLIFYSYCSALNTCSVDLLLKVGTLLPELAVHEKSVDHFIELLRKDQLDENSSVEPLEKSINYFQVTVIIGTTSRDNCYFNVGLCFGRECQNSSLLLDH